MKFLYPSLLFFLLASCQEYEDDTSIDGPLPKTDASIPFFPLEIGSTWIYGRYAINANGYETMTGMEREAITKDTVIKTQRYYKLEGREFDVPFVRFIRDSSGYYIEHTGRIWLAPEHLNEILDRDTFYDSHISLLIIFNAQMKKVAKMVSVPAGDYEVLDFEQTVTEPARTTLTEPKINHNYYAEGVGRVKHDKHFIFSRKKLERRLFKYQSP